MDAHLGVGSLDLRPDELGHGQCDVLLLTSIAYGTRVLAPVSCIQDDGE